MSADTIPRKRLRLATERIYQILTLGCMAVWVASSGISSFGAKHLFGNPLELTEGYSLRVESL